MVSNYQEFLATQVLNEGNFVNYRNLSRALKVHSNTAKEMLYDFHKTQVARKAGSLHASYLISGTRKPEQTTKTNGVNATDREDTQMQDSSFMSSSMPEQEGEESLSPIPVTSISIVREENLEAARNLYGSISSIHIYSLEPGPLKDLQVLSDCNRRVASEYASEDPLTAWKQYGTIQNPQVRRRTVRKPPPTVIAQTPATSGMKAAVKQNPMQEEPRKDAHLSRDEPDAKSTAKGTQKPTKVATLKRDSLSIMASFGKTKAPVPPQPPTGAEKSGDESMEDASDDEEDQASDLPPIDMAAAKEKAEASKKAKSDREDQLRKMMDEDDEDPDEPMDDSQADADDAAALDAPTESATAPSPAPGAEPADTDAVAPTTAPARRGDGRRRGKRKVMKKNTTKDAEGYLVTKEEAVWESFSEEDELERARVKRKEVSVAPLAGAARAAKGGRPGQGNIMSFFAKK